MSQFDNPHERPTIDPTIDANGVRMQMPGERGRIDMVVESVRFSDYISATVSRDGEIVGFSESERDGRASHADKEANGAMSGGIIGRPPQGEEGSLATCRILVRRLNSPILKWADPIDKGLPADVDCRAEPIAAGEGRLDVQVVRANTDSTHWKALAQHGRVEERHADAQAVADQIRAAIELKARQIVPPASRRPLMLAVSALDSPVMALSAAVTIFAQVHGSWASTLGFRAIWLVGPIAEMTHRLDVE